MVAPAVSGRAARRRLPVAALATALILLMGLGKTGAAAIADRMGVLRSAIDLACHALTGGDLRSIGHRLPGIDPVDPLRQGSRLMGGWRRIYPLAIGHLTIDWLAPRTVLNHIRVQLDRDDHGTPGVYALVDPHCQVTTARQIRYDAADRPVAIDHLTPALLPSGLSEPIDPPVPAMADPGGLPVAIADTGVNYTLPGLAMRLARNEAGGLVGYDYWDLDDRPFDANPFRSPFFPAHHGTGVASLIALEAPVAKLMPFRFPRPDMARFAELVDRAARQGARILNLSLASYQKPEWDGLDRAISRHPDLLFVVAAGNNQRDIDRHPVYPAALGHANLITVTAATPAGRLVRDANWGAEAVDLMVPAQRIEVTDFTGMHRRVTGSSYAAARVTALAACLLAAHPGWSVAELKAGIFDQARPAGDRPVAVGFIPEGRLGAGRCIQGGATTAAGLAPAIAPAP